MNGWMGGSINGWRMDELMDEWMERWMMVWMDIWMDGGWIDERMDRGMDE